MTRYFYQSSIQDFIEKSATNIFGEMSINDDGDTAATQKYAWSEEIEILKQALNSWKEENGEILFEYSIPRLGKRVDVVLLLRGIVFVIEFKAGEEAYLRTDMEQVMDYALDLKNFHLASHHRTIVPILVATEAKESSNNLFQSVYDDHIYNPIFANADTLSSLIERVIEKELAQPSSANDFQDWAISRYAPTPTIIEAASTLYRNHSVEDITRTEASGESLCKTTQYLIDIINRSRENGEKSICFVTGVPGAGKTLVGLNVVIQQAVANEEKDDRNLAVYLSGNGPLVKVLTAALAKDKQQQEREKGYKYNLTEAKREVSQFIQIIHRYRDNMLNKIKLPIENGTLEIDESKSIELGQSGHGEVEHVAIFDEAQRSWDLEHLSGWLARGGSRGGKKKIANFPMSEAEFLIWSLNLRKDWAVIICLVGGGQEINTGEAGISEWIRAVNTTFSNWKVYISNHLTDKEYAEGNVSKLLEKNPNKTYDERLHLPCQCVHSERKIYPASCICYLIEIKMKPNGYMNP